MYSKHNGMSSTNICKESVGSRWQLASRWGLLQIAWQPDASYGARRNGDQWVGDRDWKECGQ